MNIKLVSAAGLLFSVVSVIGTAAFLGEPPKPWPVWPEGEERRISEVFAKIRRSNSVGWVGKKLPYDIPLLDRPNGELVSPSLDAQSIHRVEVTGSFN